MVSKVFLLMCVAAAVYADFRSYSSPETYSEEYFSSPNYNFNWEVDEEEYDNFYGHQESRDDHLTKGSYYVVLPDNRHKTVNYYVDGGSGFVAEVTYDGEERYSQESDEYEPPKYYRG